MVCARHGKKSAAVRLEILDEDKCVITAWVTALTLRDIDILRSRENEIKKLLHDFEIRHGFRKDMSRPVSVIQSNLSAILTPPKAKVKIYNYKIMTPFWQFVKEGSCWYYTRRAAMRAATEEIESREKEGLCGSGLDCDRFEPCEEYDDPPYNSQLRLFGLWFLIREGVVQQARLRCLACTGELYIVQKVGNVTSEPASDDRSQEGLVGGISEFVDDM